MIKTRFSSFILGIIFFCFTLSGCDRSPAFMADPVLQNLPYEQRVLLLKIEHSGIQVIQHGMIFIFVIPTDYYFHKDTRTLKSSHEIYLDQLAEFLQRYSQFFERQPTITVTGYTDKTWLYPQRDLLSLHYADTVANYFREDGLADHAVVVVGAGAKNPIASNGYPMGTAFNRRVEVVVSEVGITSK